MPSYKVNLRGGEPASITVTKAEADEIVDAMQHGKKPIVAVVQEYTNDGKPSSNVTVIPISNVASVQYYDAGPRKRAEGVRIG